MKDEKQDGRTVCFEQIKTVKRGVKKRCDGDLAKFLQLVTDSLLIPASIVKFFNLCGLFRIILDIAALAGTHTKIVITADNGRRRLFKPGQIFCVELHFKVQMIGKCSRMI